MKKRDRREYKTQWFHENRESQLEKQRHRRQSLKDAGLCVRCGTTNSIPDQRLCEGCRDKETTRWLGRKDAVFMAYGGYVCACPGCQETNPKFLTIDHVNNNGAEERKTPGKKNTIGYLYSHNFPPGYQVLCFNCNMGRRCNGGSCPHLEAEK